MTNAQKLSENTYCFFQNLPPFLSEILLCSDQKKVNQNIKTLTSTLQPFEAFLCM